MFENLTEANVSLYQMKSYENPSCHTMDEFMDDMKRIKYIKRLFYRYHTKNQLKERLILNHLIVIFNSFGIEPSLKILKLKLEERHWPVIKPFLIYLKYIRDDDITGPCMDPTVVDRLRQI